MNYLKQYRAQKNGAKARGIDWHFTYEEWIEWWGDDITKRGRKGPDLVMARKGDTGPYHPDNCKKITHRENAREGQIGKKRKPLTDEHRAKISESHKGKKRIPLADETKKKISKANKGKFKVIIKTPLGIFYGIKAAADAHSCDHSTIRRRIKNKEGYQYA
jgi:hypothetical protein